MVENKNFRQIYDYLSSQFDVGTLEQFREKMNSAQNRKQIYETLSTAYDMGTYEGFVNKIGFKKGVDSKGFGKGGYVDVPQREFIPHFEDSAKGRRVVALKGTKSALTKIYEDFEKKFIRLLNKRIRKR